MTFARLFVEREEVREVRDGIVRARDGDTFLLRASDEIPRRRAHAGKELLFGFSRVRSFFPRSEHRIPGVGRLQREIPQMFREQMQRRGNG